MNDKPVLLEKKVNALERIKKLDEERTKLLEEATTEAKSRAEAAITDLNSLGHNFRLVEGPDGGAAPRKKRGPQKAKDPNAPCPTCKFATDPPHDGRVHRSQEVKKPFTAKELEEKGFKKRA